MMIDRAKEGQRVVTMHRPFLYARIITHTPSATSVQIENKRTTWSPQTHVRTVSDEEWQEQHPGPQPPLDQDGVKKKKKKIKPKIRKSK